MIMQRDLLLIFLKDSFSSHNYHQNHHHNETTKIIDLSANSLKINHISHPSLKITKLSWIYVVGSSTKKQEKGNLFIESMIAPSVSTSLLREKSIWLVLINKINMMMKRKRKRRNPHLYRQTRKYYLKHQFILQQSQTCQKVFLNLRDLLLFGD